MNAGRCKGCGSLVEADEVNFEDATCVNCFDLKEEITGMDSELIELAKDICKNEAEAILRAIKGQE